MSGPRLTAEVLAWRNRSARIKFKAAIACLLLLAGLGLILLERQKLADALEWLRPRAGGCAALAAFLTAVIVAQRRALQASQFPRSWLAALPVRTATARWQAFVIESLPAAIAIGAFCALALPALLVSAFDARLHVDAIAVLWAYWSGGVACGVALSYLIPRHQPAEPPPGSRYVPKPSIHRAAPIRPSIGALGLWPIRQMFATAQPKVVARALIPVLVMMPMGTKADEAMIVIALFGVMFVLSLLFSSAVAVGRAAERWLAPVPVRRGPVTRALAAPACGAAIAASVAGALLLLVFNVSYRMSAAVGAAAAVVGCLCIIAALAWSRRSRRVR